MKRVNVKSYIVLLLIIVFIKCFVIINAIIPTGSMENTIQIGDRVIASRLAYIFDEPKRGDIVIFKAPDTKELYVKRIIGLPGDIVDIIDGKVYINGELLVEDYIKETMVGSFGSYDVPEGSYFMLGDNRNNSNDSRYWDNTYLDGVDILGKVVFKYYPRVEFLN